MSDDVEPQFGAGDIAGSKFTTPSQVSEHEARLGNEAIRRKQYSRWFSLAALATLTISAVGCLLFSMWVGFHFLNGLDSAKADAKAREERLALNGTPAPLTAKQSQDKKPVKTSSNTKKEDPKQPTAESNKETFYLQILAPLIPATFSSAIAIILFITIARLVTNFERMGRENADKDPNEDYGTIAVFFQELGKFVKSFKS
ncbi:MULTISPECIES: hypothetical protein [Pseudomonas aeruginosa group]|uniref:hypothetical protein n=1 Tax=Pseudomonas aeruginosa group TaxID=136841 RepID=UPI000ACB71DB|nr:MULTISPECIES: hypothetical protein [Pseudomonas aeruginosa group]MBG4202577.1 hypothetical protein [Pseudomonas aeruginosa]MBM9930702.1 hypothetical protein [Pseudomonas aeruginosa]MBN5515902.1 hypothetical protein [Pseudomonas aeruginosa]MCF1247426.1 hypothetical protein [Pseudomonas aeruginosa]MDY1588504.1 hypothetical protein [Pseudomonas paraeruginosa]